MNTSEALTLTLKSGKFRRSRCSTWRNADSTRASGVGSPYFFCRSFSSEPALTPMRIEMPRSRAASTTALTRSARPILPGLMRRQSTPGSLEKDLQKKYGEPTPQALVESALRHVEHLDRLNFPDFKVSVKASDVFMAVEAYRLLSRQIEQPLHLGITEAGGLRSGTVKSAVGLGMLLAEGIGDTIRISLAADPVEEVKVGFDILKSLRLRSRGINFIACPSCSRQNFDVVKTMNELEQRVEDLLVPLDVAVIGCVVNGPGEAKEAHIGLTGGSPNLIYIDGKPALKLGNDNLVDELEKLIRQKAADKVAADAAVIVRG